MTIFKTIVLFLAMFVAVYAEPTTEEILESCDKRDYTIGCDMLGDMYYYGGELRQDANKAYKYYKKACILGSSNSCYKQGKMYETFARSSSSPSKEMEVAISFYIHGCELGDYENPKEPKSCSSAARLIEHRQQLLNPGVIAGIDDSDHRESLKFYILACEARDNQGCRKIQRAKILYSARIESRAKSIGSMAGAEYGINKSAAEGFIRNKCDKHSQYDSTYFNPYHSENAVTAYYNKCIDIATGVYFGN